MILDAETSQKIDGICVGRMSDTEITVAVVDPTETYIWDLIDLVSDHKLKPTFVQADPGLLALAREFVFETPLALQGEPWKQWIQSKRFESSAVEIKKLDDDATTGEVSGEIVELADRIIKEAVSLGASDIHLESYHDGLVVRYREDGVLRTVNQIADRRKARALVKRLKVMSGMEVTQDRVTQGGRMSLTLGEEGFDFRVSVLPVASGESMVLRILNKKVGHIELSELGMSDKSFDSFKKFISKPHGLILTCGPTGSGKSTTLYASLITISRPDRKILTVEDPVEYDMPGVVQVPVNTAPREAERRVTFGRALREFLRHDPDVILVGEIRDKETAEVSVQSALTGHLVLSTIHANDSVGVVSRLKERGIPPFLIASVLRGAVSQRLLRKLCSKCAKAAQASPEDTALFQEYGIEPENIREAVGCSACRGTGYKGRIGVFEVLPLSRDIRDAVERGATATELHQLARANGMESLLEDGLRKVSSGLVSLDEVRRVCDVDDD